MMTKNGGTVISMMTAATQPPEDLDCVCSVVGKDDASGEMNSWKSSRRQPSSIIDHAFQIVTLSSLTSLLLVTSSSGSCSLE